MKINGKTFSANFTYRDARSHLLHIGHEGMSSLGLQPGDSIRVKLYKKYMSWKKYNDVIWCHLILVIRECEEIKYE